jgi:hypothetical protein
MKCNVEIGDLVIASSVKTTEDSDALILCLKKHTTLSKLKKSSLISGKDKE